MPYHIAGIDVHKKMLAMVVADVAVDGDYHFEQLKTGTSPAQLRALADWLTERDVAEVVMESTAQYWRPVWEALERRWQPRRARDGAPAHLYLAQAQSNRGVGGRKKDFPDAERLVKRLVAQELTLSFVPHTEQRLWRTVMRRRYQFTRKSRPAAESTRSAPRRSASQALQPGLRSPRHQCATHAAGHRRWCDGAVHRRRTRRSAITGDA